MECNCFGQYKVKEGQQQRGSYVVFGQQARAELQVVVEVKGTASFEPGTEGGDGGSLGEFTHALDAPELAVGVLRLGLWGSAGAASVVVVVVVMAVVVVVVVRRSGSSGGHVGWGHRVLLVMVVLLLVVLVLEVVVRLVVPREEIRRHRDGDGDESTNECTTTVF